MGPFKKGISTMKKLGGALAVFALVSLATVTGGALIIWALPVIGAAQANGVDFETNCGGGGGAYDRIECRSFVAGVVAGLQISPHPHICFPENFDRRQSLPIVLDWMRSHPDMLNWGPVRLIRQALRETYPCGNGVPAISH
jgi:hypothetical protein